MGSLFDAAARILLSALFASMALASAGQGRGVVKGRCIDTSGAPVEGVEVRLLNTGLSTATGREGAFSLFSVAPGRYTLSLTSPSYAELLMDLSAVADGDLSMGDIVLRDAGRILSEVVVTGDRRETRAERSAMAATSFGARQVAELRLWDLSQLTALVPNLYTAEPGDGRNVTGIRGIATTSYDPAVATYVDGVNQFSLDTHLPQLSDVERVEVLRGPQGTLFGRNAMGGVVLVTTRKPTDRTTGFAELSAGSHGLQRHIAGFRTPLVKDRLYLGSSAMLHRRRGYHLNLYDGSDFDRMRQLYGNHYLRWTPSQAWTVVLNLKHLSGRNEGAFPLSPDPVTAKDEPHRLNQNATSTMSDNTLDASLAVTKDHRRFRMTAVTAYQANHRFYSPPIDGDFSPLDIVSIRNDYGEGMNRNRVWTQEIRFQEPTGDDGPWKWTAGVFLFDQHNPVRQATLFGRDAGVFGVTGAPFSITNQNVSSAQGWAGFGQATRNLGGRWRFTTGLRHDRETRRLAVRSEFEAPGSPAVVTRPDTSARRSYSALSPKLGIQYLIDDAQQVYLNYSRGFRTGGLTPVGSDPSAPPLFAFGPESSDNLEAGWKLRTAENRFRMGVYAFLSRVTDVQTPTLLLPDAVTVTRNTGDLRSHGMELEMEAVPVRGLEMRLAGGFTDARYRRLLLSVDGEEKDLKGNRQILTPSHTLMTSAQYGWPVGRRRSTLLQGRVECLLTGRTFFDLRNEISQNAYALMNARVGLQMRKISLHLWARNLTRTLYIDYAYDFGASHLGAPRTWGATLAFRH